MGYWKPLHFFIFSCFVYNCSECWMVEKVEFDLCFLCSWLSPFNCASFIVFSVSPVRHSNEIKIDDCIHWNGGWITFDAHKMIHDTHIFYAKLKNVLKLKWFKRTRKIKCNWMNIEVMPFEVCRIKWKWIFWNNFSLDVSMFHWIGSNWGVQCACSK